MKIAVDIGYSTVKGVSSTDKPAMLLIRPSQVIFPSVTAPAGEDLLAGMLTNTMKHQVRVRRSLQDVQDYLVGEAAMTSSLATGFLAQREKPDGIHDLLLLTVAYLLAYNENVLTQLEVAIGLPLAYYRTQKDELRKRLEGYSAWVSVNGGRDICLQLQKVTVFPQGAGALMAADLSDKGMAVLLDIGSYTTDYLVFDIRQGQPMLIPECCGSIEAGVSLVTRALADDFLRQTGAPLPARMQEATLAKALAGEQVIYLGRQVDLGGSLDAARKRVGALIASNVAGALRDRTGFVTQTILAGGGALLFDQEIALALPGAKVIDDPVFANARGFLSNLMTQS